MFISNTTMSNYASRLVNINTNQAADTMYKLSSGYQINKAADNAAGLAISEKMRGQIRGLDQASRNIDDGISLIQTADAAMQEISNIMVRMRELTVQAVNDTNVEEDRKAIQQEIDTLVDEIDRIANDTEFNQVKLLNNTWGNEKAEYKSLGDIVGISNMTGDGSLSEKLIFGTLGDSTTSSPSSTDSLKAAHIDFGRLNQPDGFKVDDLYGMGFNSTCSTCTMHYSLKLTEDTGSKIAVNSGHYTLEIGIKGLNASSTGKDVVDLIMKELKLKDNTNFISHFTQYGSIGSTLYIFDKRQTAGNMDTFEGSVYGEDKPIDAARKPFHIQVGANQGQQIAMELPFVTAKELGVDEILRYG